MKGLMVFLLVALCASAYASPSSMDKSIIDDIMEMKDCLEKAFAAIEADIANVIEVISGLGNMASTIVEGLKKCSELTDPMAIANCVMSLTESIPADVANAIAELKASIDSLISNAENAIAKCIKV